MTPDDLMDAIQRIAEHVVGTTYERLPPAAVAAARIFLLDTLGVAIAGGGEPGAASLQESARGWGRGEEAGIWGTADRLPAPSAALVNAFLIHGLEFDCVHEGAVVHPMATLLPVLLAEADRRGHVSGRDLLTAIAVGVDVAAALGLAARGPMQFFRPATAGAFGATAGLGRLRGLDVDTLVSAFGLVSGHVSGTLQAHAEGSALLALQMGFAARGAWTAVDLAERGFAGPRAVLEGRYGYFPLFERGAYDLEPVLRELGHVWRVAELSHKPFPSGRLTHGAIDALLVLRAQHGLDVDRVARVVVRVPPLVHRLVGRPPMADAPASYARLCLPSVAALALRHGGVDVPDFRGARLHDPDVHALAARIETVADDNPDENALVPQRIQVTHRDGSAHETIVASVLGSPARPLSRDAQLAKFRRCWTYGARPLPAERREALITLVDELDAVDDTRRLLAFLAP